MLVGPTPTASSAPASSATLRSFQIPNMNDFTNYGQFVHALVNVIRTHYGFSINNLVGDAACFTAPHGGGSSITSEFLGRVVELDDLALSELQGELWDPAAAVERPDLLTYMSSREKAAAHNLRVKALASDALLVLSALSAPTLPSALSAPPLPSAAAAIDLEGSVADRATSAAEPRTPDPSREAALVDTDEVTTPTQGALRPTPFVDTNVFRSLNLGRTAPPAPDGAGAADAARAVGSSAQVNATKQRVARKLAAHQARYALAISAILPTGVGSPAVLENLGISVVLAIENALTAQNVLFDCIVTMAQQAGRDGSPVGRPLASRLEDDNADYTFQQATKNKQICSKMTTLETTYGIYPCGQATCHIARLVHVPVGTPTLFLDVMTAANKVQFADGHGNLRLSKAFLFLNAPIVIARRRGSEMNYDALARAIMHSIVRTPDSDYFDEVEGLSWRQFTHLTATRLVAHSVHVPFTLDDFESLMQQLGAFAHSEEMRDAVRLSARALQQVARGDHGTGSALAEVADAFTDPTPAPGAGDVLGDWEQEPCHFGGGRWELDPRGGWAQMYDLSRVIRDVGSLLRAQQQNVYPPLLDIGGAYFRDPVRQMGQIDAFADEPMPCWNPSCAATLRNNVTRSLAYCSTCGHYKPGSWRCSLCNMVTAGEDSRCRNLYSGCPGLQREHVRSRVDTSVGSADYLDGQRLLGLRNAQRGAGSSGVGAQGVRGPSALALSDRARAATAGKSGGKGGGKSGGKGGDRGGGRNVGRGGPRA